MFLDHAVINVRAGHGGEGVVSWRRETYIPHGGPDGGDGGKGADVILRVDSQLATLMDYRYRREYRADNGNKGESSNRTGRSGEALVLRVPPGTTVRDAATEEVIVELLEDGENSVLVPPGDPTAAAAALDRLLSNGALAARLGAAALARSRGLTWDARARAIASFLEERLSRP